MRTPPPPETAIIAPTDPHLTSRLAANLARVRERIAAAAERAGRDAAAVRLVGVTKYVGPEVIRELLALGLRDLGENRVQQLSQRVQELGSSRGDLADAGPPPAPCWHMIGHLQRNKVRPLLPDCRIVHGLDSTRLAEELDRRAAAAGIPIDVLIEVNVSGEAQKEGVAANDLAAVAEDVLRRPALRLRGLMTMAPLEAPESECRRVFAALRGCLEDMQRRGAPPECRELSMGMTGDFEAAIAEGATIVRIGSALFA